ncbi:hypothetical protein WMF27_11185 [Sorangium sp. So ce281]|uniref:hypothetical protein n=1 Tax=Sorangium sp. So ce281 TaxID=3133293 RepID=UPI003F62C8EC
MTRSEDERAIDAVVHAFFQASGNKGGVRPDLDALRALFLAEGVIIKTCGEPPTIYDLRSFIEPREKLLRSHALAPADAARRRPARRRPRRARSAHLPEVPVIRAARPEEAEQPLDRLTLAPDGAARVEPGRARRHRSARRAATQEASNRRPGSSSVITACPSTGSGPVPRRASL